MQQLTSLMKFSLYSRFFKAALRWKDLFFYLIRTDLKLSYSNKALGYFWSLFDPIVMSAVYLFLVVYIFGRGYPGFAANLFVSLLIWRWVGGSINQSIVSFPSKSRLLLTIRFPKLLLPLTAVSLPLTRLLLGIIWVLPLMLLQRVSPTIGLFWIFPMLAVTFLICGGLSLFLSILGVYFRDLTNIAALFLRVGFYCSPILYSVEDTVPEQYRNLYMLNPFAPIFDGVTRAIRFGQPPSLWIFWPIVLSIVLLFAGLYFFKSKSKNIVKDL